MTDEVTASRIAAVRAICVHALNEVPRRVRPIVGDGVVNTVFDVETPRRQLIFRIQFDAPFDGAFRKEAWCMEQARAVGVPVPELIDVGTFASHAFAIHVKVHGVVGNRYDGDLDSVWRQIGRHARRFHQVKALGFGEHLGGPVGESPDLTLRGWADWWDQYIFTSPLLLERGILSAGGFDSARSLVSEIGAWPGEPRLCHGNLTLDNVIIDARGEVVVLDWGTAAGHLAPELDLAELHVWSLNPEPPSVVPFLKGYEFSTSEYAGMQRSVDLLQLWRALSAGRWLIEQGKAHQARIEFFQQKLRALLGDLAV